MRVNRIISLSFACVAAGSCYLAVSSRQSANNEANNVKQNAIELVESSKVAKLEKNAPKCFVTNSKSFEKGIAYAKYWDSVAYEAKAKKAYQEGAQMVRDSIKKANLK